MTFMSFVESRTRRAIPIHNYSGKATGLGVPERTIIAREGEVCHKAIKYFPKTRCEPGLVCQPRPNSGMGGSWYCQRNNPLAPVLAKKNEVCSKPIIGFKSRECEAPYVCRPRNTHSDRAMTGVSSYCLDPIQQNEIIGLVGQECYRAVRGYQKVRCQKGLKCLPPQDKRSGGAHTCQPKVVINVIEENLAQEGDVCNRPIPDFKPLKCAKGLICKPNPGEEELSGVPSYCQRLRLRLKTNLQ